MLRKKFREILKDLNLVTDAQLTEAVEEQKKTGKLLGHILVKKGYAAQSDIAQALAKQVGLPFVEAVTEQMADPSLLSKVPLKFLRQHLVIPIIYEGTKTILTANPRDLQPLDNLALLMEGAISYGIAPESVILDAINKYYPLETSSEMMEELKEGDEDLTLESIEEKDIMEMANEAPIVKLVNHMIFQAVKEDASDIHIEPFEKELSIRYRIDGILYSKILPPKRYQSAIVSRIKIMAHLNIAEKRLPQDGRIQLKVADRAIDIRVSVLPCNFGERVVMRLLDKTKGVIKLDHLNMGEHNLELVTRTIERPNGIVLVTGPTGSGKTTTLYAILNHLNQTNVNIITVEDPVEYTISGVNQVQVKEEIGLTFSAVLRSILRQDPDIVLIGEMRDGETAQIATQAALTGHLVLSTVHTNNAPATITRLIDMGVEPYLIASSVISIMSQRLVRRLCEKCKSEYKPSPEMINRVGLTNAEAAKVTFYKPIGCHDCLNMGYKGRMAIFEIMPITDSIARLIVGKADVLAIKKTALKEGMRPLSVDGVRVIKQGITTIEEILSVAFVENVVEEAR